MNNQATWQTIATAPFGQELELAVIEGDHIHALVFACRRQPDGWIKVASHERIAVSPTHWRLWAPRQTIEHPRRG